MDNQNILGERLKETRLKLGLTQKAFVEGIDVNVPAYSSWETGVSQPSVKALREIALKYNVSVDWLLGLAGKEFSLSTIDTYDVLCKLLCDLAAVKHMRIKVESHYHFPILDGNNNLLRYEYLDVITLESVNEEFRKFIEGLSKIAELHSQGLIDDDLYALWCQKEYNKFLGILIKDGEIPLEAVATEQ